LDQMSAHPLAKALVAGAERRDLQLTIPENAEESFGSGVSGTVEGHPGVVGGEAKVLVAVDGHLAGVALVGDRVREDSSELVPKLRDAGVEYVALVTGDKETVADAVGARLGVDRVYAGQTPEEKVDVVRATLEQPSLRNVVMVGDGINDAPALAVADVGIAMGSAGATVSSETADAVVLVDRVD